MSATGAKRGEDHQRCPWWAEHHSLAAVTVWSRALLAVTGVGLRWKSFKKPESVKAGAMWRRSNVSLWLSLTEVKFFVALMRLAGSLSAHLYIPPLKTQSVLMKHPLHQHPHRPIQHPHEYHHSLLGTATALWHLIGNLKWNLLLPSEATWASFSLFSL